MGYNDNDYIISLCIKLRQMIGYAKYFDNNKTMSCKVSDKKVLQKYTKIREKICSLIGKVFDSEPVHGDNNKYIKTKMK